MIKLESRGEVSQTWIWATPLLAIALTLIAGGIIFAILGSDPLATLYMFFIAPITDAYGLSELGVKATPIILCAIGLSFGFRANVWNIGAEGQYVFGAIFGGGMALAFYNMEGWYILPIMMIFGMIGGALWAAIPAFLKTRFNTNEILVSLMLNYIAILVLSYLVHGPFRDPEGFNFPESRLFSDSAILPALYEDGRIHFGAILALFAVVTGWALLSRHMIGFQIRVAGFAPMAARYAGFSAKKIIWMTLLIAGALSGLAGVSEVSGVGGQLTPTVAVGYGYTAIIVAFIGRLHPVGILGGGLLLALTYLGGENVQINANLPQSVSQVFQGMLLFWLLACDVLIRYRVKFSFSRARA